MVNKCECKNHGMCDRHKVNKGEKEFEICNTQAGFKFFEMLYGNKNKPNILEKTINFGKAIIKDIGNGMRRVSSDIEKNRLEICLSCPLFSENRTCMSCGCPVDSKIKIASESCPEGKWSSDNITNEKCFKCNN